MHGAEAALLTICWTAAAGLFAQMLAYRWRIPAIVPLLAVGVLLGPSVLGVIQPAALGAGLSVIVKLSVAVILFDGALNLRLNDLRQAKSEVRDLVTVGLLITFVGATLAARLIAELSWTVAIVFGTLLTVTGPTVVQPLLKRVSLPRKLRTVLEGEAILIDPIGAVLAVSAVDIVLGLAGVHPIGFFSGIWGYVGRLLIGLGVGVLGAFGLSWLMRRRRVVPEELANVVSLAGVWLVFGISEWLQAESGIMSAVAMGLALQRGAVPEERRLRRFKEQLTVLGISLIFVLLAAALPLEILRAEGWRGLLTVGALMFVVRPLDIFISLRKSTLTWREKTFAAWIAPRGIVAASVASLFALSLTQAGFAEGQRLLAITFLTIGLTVTLQGLSAAPVARLLRLQSLEGKRAIVVGAGPFGRGIAEMLREHGRPVVIVDRNPQLVAQATQAGFEAVVGNALEEATLESAGADEAESVVAVTTNSEVNALAAHLAHDAFGVRRALPAVGRPERGAGPELAGRVGVEIAFGKPVDVRAWEYELHQGTARFVSHIITADQSGVTGRQLKDLAIPDELLPLARVRGESLELAHPEQTWQRGDEIVLLSRVEARDVRALLDRAAASRQAASRPEGVA